MQDREGGDLDTVLVVNKLARLLRTEQAVVELVRHGLHATARDDSPFALGVPCSDFLNVLDQSRRPKLWSVAGRPPHVQRRITRPAHRVEEGQNAAEDMSLVRRAAPH
jgi:hypothetical protein